MTENEKQRFFELAQKDAVRYENECAALGGKTPKRKRTKDPNAPKRAL